MSTFGEVSALFLDFDSFFASVEQHMHPELRGRPIGIAPVLTDTSCCIAASYEAKAFGVKTGTGVREAKSLCPEILIVEAKPPEYIKYHHQLVAAVESCIHVEATLSIDELWCLLPENLRTREQIDELAYRIKRAIAREVSPYITCTIGVAQNRWLAKMASKMRKPDGYLLLLPEDLPEALYGLKLSDVHGVGSSMELRLHARGIHTVKQLCEASRSKLHSVWGSIEGERLWMNLHGAVLPEREVERRSIGHSHVLSPEKREQDKALPVLHKLTQKAAVRLRSHGMLAGSLHIQIRYVHGPSWAAECRFEHSADSILFARTVKRLWRQRPDKSTKILKLSMTLAHLLEEANHTPSLFEADMRPRMELSRTMDRIQAKLGRKAIHLGCDHDALADAPMRISFTHIPDLGLEGSADLHEDEA
ncbi:DNA polymerase IV [Rubritalea halochordaticola]|uniref:DNA polymerase IV n=1 Tax=Rubritalea halochordaticola TaxID=714537 RepID=A0ABP9UVL2_9BACT